ncbi:MAG: ATP-dependent DNA helicase [Deltaproteobacteria bacterium]|nr:ATP-dependent DNA helicase [Deltaproteobacteria bacterium]
MSLRFDDEARTLVLGVHDLIEAGPRSGHLRVQLAQSRMARLAAGREVHQTYQAWRQELDEDYQAEVPVKVSVVVRGWECKVRGRLDGVCREGGALVVEEIKSSALDGAALRRTQIEDWPDYAEQVALYRYLLHAGGSGDAIGRLVLVSLLDSARHVLQVDDPLEEIRLRVEARLEWIIRQREARNAWMAVRRAASVDFPHAEPRPLQAEISAEVAEAMRRGQQLLVSAPTGVGKTAAVMHGALTEAYTHDMRVFFATAKGTQQEIFDRTLANFARKGLPLRAVTIRAKEKSCLNGVVDCRPESCPYAEGYFDRASEVVESLIPLGVHRAEALIAEAERRRVCPFELTLDLSEHVDVVVGDYNYVFNPRASLKRHFGDRYKDWILVVDEAHNLVERCRDQLSPSLSAAAANAASLALGREDPKGLAAYVELCRDIRVAIEDLELDIEGPVSRDGEAVVGVTWRIFRDLRDRADELALDYAFLRRDKPAAGDTDHYLDLARALIHFVDVLEESRKLGEGGEIVPILRTKPTLEVQLVCVDPSPWVKRILDGFGGVVLMSATLEPPRFYQDLLGLDEQRVAMARFASPFPPENLGVVLATKVSTAWRDRQQHRERTAALLCELIEATPGNVAIYYSAFSLLQQLSPMTEVAGRESLVQTPRMSEADRLELIDRLRQIGHPRVLHAVLGGIFAEGMDLPGGVLDGIFIVGPALPRVGLDRDLMRARYEERYGDGFGYAFLVPGMSRVIQAAGRLVRGPQDRGAVVLVGRRFGWSAYSAFFPSFWELRSEDHPAEAVRAFWSEQEPAG